MMKRKIIALLLALPLVLSMAVCVGKPTQAISKEKAVEIAPHHDKFAKVITTKRITIRKIIMGSTAYKDRVGRKILIPKKTKLRVQKTGTGFGWYIQWPGHKGTYTILHRINDFSWFKLR